jgi:hypothetical protein
MISPCDSNRSWIALVIKTVMVATMSIVASFRVTHALAAPGDPAAGPADRPAAWTLDEAQSHLKLYPHDTYVKYLALQLARREGKVAEVARQIDGGRWLGNLARQRRDSVDLFSIFSGALAVQESLQLDAMIADQPGIAAPGEFPGDRRLGFPQRPADPGRQGPRPIGGPNVAIAELTGPTIKSHPWDKMLASRRPEVSLLARSVPADFYFAEFRSVNKLTEATKIADLWATHLFNQSVQDAQTQLVDQRLREQLAVEVTPLLAPIYDSVVERVAVTGSDLFYREGSDITLLFQVSQPVVFRTHMDKFMATAAAEPDAQRTSGKYQGVDFETVQTPDRRIHVFSAYPTPQLHVRSNSRVALERIIDAIRGKSADGKTVHRLGETSEFAYIRTLLPPNALEEDGLIYLSDPFMRRMVGPELRLTERRRVVCYSNLKMIGYASLMHRTEYGKSAASLGELASTACVPGEFGAGKLACPDGGTYSLAADGLTGLCSHHGYASYLSPCNEIEVHDVTAPEANGYRQFLEQYNNYWRVYFDPIAVRLTISPQRYRAETIVLPLIDNTVYSRLATMLGDKPEPLDVLPVPTRNIFTFAVRFDKRALLRELQMDALLEEPESPNAEQQQTAAELKHSVLTLKQLALAHLNYEASRRRLAPAATTDREGKPLLSWRVEMLPFLDQQDLYNQFHRDEPWDSEHNKQLISRMPDIFRSRNAKLAEAGKTKFVVPTGGATLFPADNQRITFSKVSDGPSQTILLAEVADDRAVIWTKPDDLTYDAEEPGQGLDSRSGEGYLIACCDGSVHQIDPKIGNAALAAAFSRAGRETANWREFDRPLPSTRVSGGPFFFGMPVELVQQLQLGQFIAKGIGNQIAFNVYDAQQLFDLSLPQALGQSLGSFRGMGTRGPNSEMLWIALLVGSLNSPVYVSVPVANGEVVDDFLARLDDFLIMLPHERGWEFFRLDHDFYQIPTGDASIRTYAVSFGPVKWRFFWQRIGNALYVASQRDILEDLAAIHSQGGPRSKKTGPTAHALVRLRPQHWNQVLDHYRLGWEENNRWACLNNLGPLSSLSRAIAASRQPNSKPLTNAELDEAAARLFDVRYVCPDDGQYSIAAQGAVTCSSHGSAAAPRQTISPAPTSNLGKLLDEFADISLSLTFLEDGLHAVVDLERKK